MPTLEAYENLKELIETGYKKTRESIIAKLPRPARYLRVSTISLIDQDWATGETEKTLDLYHNNTESDKYLTALGFYTAAALDSIPHIIVIINDENVTKQINNTFFADGVNILQEADLITMPSGILIEKNKKVQIRMIKPADNTTWACRAKAVIRD